MTRPRAKSSASAATTATTPRRWAMTFPKEPLIFLKPPSSVIEAGDPSSSAAVLAGGARRRDRRHHRRRSARKAREARLAGRLQRIVAANDVTARDLQKSESQWTRAKGFDTFCPLGEPASPPADFGISPWSPASTASSASAERAPTWCSRFPTFSRTSHIVMTLEPGDLVLTGTPGGSWEPLAGDEVEVEILGVSRVRNPSVSPTATRLSAATRRSVSVPCPSIRSRPSRRRSGTADRAGVDVIDLGAGDADLAPPPQAVDSACSGGPHAGHEPLRLRARTRRLSRGRIGVDAEALRRARRSDDARSFR